MTKSCGMAVACGHVLCGRDVRVNEELLWNCGCLWACSLCRGVGVNRTILELLFFVGKFFVFEGGCKLANLVELQLLVGMLIYTNPPPQRTCPRTFAIP